jgi:hypothetical protein
LWNQSCASGASLSLDAVRQEVRNLLPNEKIAADVVSKFSPCEVEVAAPAAPIAKAASVASTVAAPASVATPPGCVEMSSQQAMARIKSQASPNIQIDRLPLVPVDFRVRVRIDENGNVSVKAIEGSTAYVNEAMRVAIERWRFLPAVVQDQRRCVDTELQVALKRGA